MNEILTAALAAAERGWPVFMLGRSKRPVANCDDCRDRHRPRPGDLRAPDLPRLLRRHHRPGPRRRDRRRRPARTARRPDRRRVRPPGGRRRPAHGGNASLADLDRAHSWCRARCGSSPALVGCTCTTATPASRCRRGRCPDRPGIDIKADGGYVVLPPSIHHRTGRPYRWGDGRGRRGGDAPRPRRRLPAAYAGRIVHPADQPNHDTTGRGHLPPGQAPRRPPGRRTPRPRRQAPHHPLRRRERRRADGRGRSHRPAPPPSPH